MGIGTFVRSSARPAAAPSGREKPRHSDLVLVAALAALSVFGLLMVFSASTDFSLLEYREDYGEGFAPYFIFVKQVGLMAVGGLVAFALSRINYRIIRKLAIPLMVLSLASLVLVLLFGQEILGSRRTFVGGSFQPSELAKLVTIIYLAVWLYTRRDSLHDITLGLIPLAVILGSVGGLILMEPDISAGVTIFALGGLLFFLAGGDWKQIAILLVLTLVVIWLYTRFSLTAQDRMAAYINGLRNPLESSDHMLYSIESIVHGGFFGVGIGRADLKVEGLPFAHTDSIFSVVIEELGLLGGLGLLVLYGVLVWRGMKIAAEAPDLLGRLLAGGLTFWIGLEALMNMAVLVGVMPFAGNALPFISAGGSNLLTMMAAVGLLVGISRQPVKKNPETIADLRRSYSASVDLRRGNRRRSQSSPRRP